MTQTVRRPLVISPHLDDAVFSCGALLAASPGAIVCTIFAGTPREPLSTDWDRQCGFDNAQEAMPARHAEDIAALQMLDARAVHLTFLDSQYLHGNADHTSDIATAIREVMRENDHDSLLIPLGLFHSDHALVHAAARDTCLSDAPMACIAYEDGLYRRMNGLVQMRLVDLAQRGIEATPRVDPSGPPDSARLQHCFEAKQRAVQCYASQLRAFGPNGYDDVLAPERFWTLRVSDRRA